MKILSHEEIADLVAHVIRKGNEEIPTENDITDHIKKYGKIYDQNLSLEDQKNILDIISSRMSVNMDVGVHITDKDTYKPWFLNRKASIDFFYWDRYKEYLLQDKGRPENVVNTLDKVSSEILDFLGNPADKSHWKRRGLILGDIQSGKTQTYNSLINKAADAGYDLIVVLTGIQESLRKQTQERIDCEFIGLKSKYQSNHEYIGVGNINKSRTAFSVTNIDSDFNMDRAKSQNYKASTINEPIVFVMKKNTKILEYFVKWLNSSYNDSNHEKIDKPLLLIDDEADNASVNTKNADSDPTAINRKIRDIIHSFNRSSYVAVTATPFANIFINPDEQFNEKDDLFPSDFIYALSPPTNYIGCDAVFGDNAEHSSCLEVIEDADGYFKSKERAKHRVYYLPQSLKVAINYFLLCNVARDIIGLKTDHRTMLVNVSQYCLTQESTYEMISDYLLKIQNDIKAYSKKAIHETLQIESIRFLSKIWNEKELNDQTKKKFTEIIPLLMESILPVTITMINTSKKMKSLERLDYEVNKENGLRVIVVGGNSLSRGLTLEGLCVSYFYRESKMYDTLLQMGRWFGYRTGYEKLVKVWMSEKTMDWFKFINDACEELRSEINVMNKQNKTPKDFGLKILDHPGTLMVTAGNKMRTAQILEIWLSLSGMLRETAWLPVKTVEKNYTLTEKFLEKISKSHTQVIPISSCLFDNVSSDLITDFISEFACEQVYNCFSTNDIVKYINENKMYLNEWYIYVVPTGSDDEVKEIAGLKIKRSVRKMEVDEEKQII
ncbi:MAG: Z1 domain-containing protein, partial [Candidatus Cloacimonetes bacterium]|nr:Z1 domain-containing protein [Candidatus Cloacimonadota bacterium]